ncbi:MAG: S-methyl-5'-thioadenosine phosphorylase [Leptospiraceae bacterium]|nr:S-methyl-5'-thioadenosine phosphorylase [Leptospiraceae bacterium]MDW7975229.1 S-methyl-5'-thioadenosine phosphorylase [Leptospiraceae bacterium]
MDSVVVGVIGGSGFYQIEEIEIIKEYYPDTPWGKPSDVIFIGKYQDILIAFLSRHGRGHVYNPTEVPYRANIAAMKSLGVEHIIAFSAVGSLREEIKPRDFVLPHQIIDRTKGIRPSTFFENGVVGHIMFADPFSHSLAEVIYAYRHILDVNMHINKTLICMEGPAFSTRAESHLYRSWGADIINMSVLPEAKLAREAEISYQMVCMSTDYDCWKEDEEAVSVEMVIENLHRNTENAKKLLKAILPDVVKLPNPYRGTVEKAIITSKEKRNPEQLQKLRFLFPDL